MAELSFLLGILGNISAFLILLSPIGTFARIVKKRSTEDFSSFPYICMVLNASLWTYYGIIKPDALLTTVNGSGVVISTVYLSLYLVFAPPKARVRTAAVAAVMDVGIVAAAIWVSGWELEGESSISFTGFLCACFNLLRYASPLSIMKEVVMTKSVEYMPLLLSICLCANGLIWAIYAMLVRDIFLLVSLLFALLYFFTLLIVSRYTNFHHIKLKLLPPNTRSFSYSDFSRACQLSTNQY
ncbi:bidirectional sugar transporter SWEET17-like isoform X1 [Salvia miltiorrhiza]|uniref:bidirectional sugar transporter SWEET17-like isoform X1 n=1 Tax=Salvia miltiorrhiza TaxID=226208 RepID=UPI0025AD5DF8|nr:bidirectional sugar transporter SWEET17-like isoform X1 [Salvia miltiorrhiza]